jgi:ribosomal protein S18 acetylase RimI-like enzyme
MIKIENGSVKDIPVIQQIAEETWWPTYSPILTSEQIRYMLDSIYSSEILQNAMQTGSQNFILLTDEKGSQGFASYGKRPNDPQVYKLHKIYVLPANHGKGYGKLLIEEVKRRMMDLHSHTLDLNVNRHNPAKSFYEKIGFRIIGEEDIPVGPYWMNDYVMRLELTP